ncbi:MAG: PHP domain-containing protein [Thermomicrobiales bacterium]
MSGAKSVRADLHTHSTASDGMDSPAALVSLASERGVSVLALTDHDTVGGVAEASDAASVAGLEFIPGVEFSIRARRGQTHILGYGIDVENDRLTVELKSLREGRETRSSKILERLRSLGIEIPEGAVTTGEPGHAPGRPHIARALMDIGAVSSVSEAFERYLAVGRPAFVPRRTLGAGEAIEIIHEAGGLAVLAHPLSVHQLDDTLPLLVEAGLDGIEIYYAEYDQDQRRSLANRASAYNLLSTGGSDYHGDLNHADRVLGSVTWPEEALEVIVKHLK